MYEPAHFAQPDPAALARLMHEYPLATVLRQSAEGDLCADLLPLMWVPSPDGSGGLLRGHVARANPLAQVPDDTAVLAVFQGPQAYITPSWYAAKADTGKVVPTWNYAVVQAHGTLKHVAEPAALLSLVTELTGRHEGPREHPWAVSDAPSDYIESLLRAIIGIEITVTRLSGKWKMSQNRSRADRRGVAQGLQAETQAVAQSVALWVLPSDDA